MIIVFCQSECTYPVASRVHDPPSDELIGGVVYARSRRREDGREHVHSSEVSVDVVHVANHLKANINLQNE